MDGAYIYVVSAKLHRVTASVFLVVTGILFVVYASCTKPGAAPLCKGVVCENEGYCEKGKCVCPVGYEGANCALAASSKFIGTWDVTQLTLGSTQRDELGKEVKYIAQLQATATPTTFFINRFLDNPSYNEITCTLDSANSNHFVVDSVRDQNMIYGIVYILPGSNGYIYTTRPEINPPPNVRWIVPSYPRIEARYFIRKLNAAHVWQVDTLDIVMTPHK